LIKPNIEHTKKFNLSSKLTTEEHGVRNSQNKFQLIAAKRSLCVRSFEKINRLIARFHSPRIALLFCAIVLMALCCFLLIDGCSKSNGPTAPSTPAILQGNQAFHAGAVATYQSYQCRRAISFAGFGLASPTGSKIRRIVANSISQSYGSTALKRTSKLTGTLTFVPYLNLYTDGGSFNGNIATVRYYSDAAGTDSAGNVTITLPTNVTNPLDPTSYAFYPATVTIAINITGGNLPCTGNLVISFSGGTGANTMTGTNTLTKDNVVFNLNLTLDNQMNASGSITVTESGATLQLDSVKGNIATPPLTCNVVVSPYGWTGTGTLNLMTGSMTANVNTGTGTSTAASDSLYNLNITYADGTHEIVVNALSGGLTGNGGTSASITATSGTPQSAMVNTAFASPLVATVKDPSGNPMSGATVTFIAPSTGQSGTFTGGVTTITTTTNALGQAQVTITANATAGNYNVTASVAGVTTTAVFVLTNTGTVSIAFYKAPLIFTSSQRTIVTINNNGQSVGYLPRTGSGYNVPVYWATPTAQPQTLTSSSDTAFTVNGLNDSSQIVGGRFLNTGGGYKPTNALYWSSPTAQPKILAVPNNTVYTEAMSINNSGQIAGWALTNTGYTFFYWTSPNDTPQVLQSPAGFSGSTIIIAPNGQIIANNGISGAFWASPNVPGVTLKGLNANDLTIPLSENAAGVIVGMSNGAVTWANYTAPAQALPVPQGWNGSVASSINTAGVIVGASMNGSNYVGIIWKNGQVQDLNTLIPSGNSWTLGATTLITDQGWILGTANNSADQTAQYILTPK